MGEKNTFINRNRCTQSFDLDTFFPAETFHEDFFGEIPESGRDSDVDGDVQRRVERHQQDGQHPKPIVSQRTPFRAGRSIVKVPDVCWKKEKQVPQGYNLCVLVRGLYFEVLITRSVFHTMHPTILAERN